MHTLGIIVPYRDRPDQLERFVPHIKDYLEGSGTTDYIVIVVEQSGKGEFNRGALLNIGFLEAERLGCDYVVFHDLDMLPVEADYSYTSKVSQIARKFFPKQISIPYDYFGGVTLFPVDKFRKVGGYSNEYWGWGYEDNDLLLRCVEAGYCSGEVRYKQPSTCGQAIGFNGNSYVSFKKPVDLKKSFLFFVDFEIDDLPVDIDRAQDESCIFSIPGTDLALAYDSFGTYKFELFDTYEDVYSIHTEKMPKMHCQAIVHYNSDKQEIRFYLNGNLIGCKPIQKGRRIKVLSDLMYLGIGSPEREGDQKAFYGKVRAFVAIRHCSDDRLLQILERGITSVDREDAAVWFEASKVDFDNEILEDLSGHGNDAKVVNCEADRILRSDQHIEYVPEHREGLYRLQKHQGNGAVDGYWKSWSTRLNQKRYNECEKGLSDRKVDGLKTIENMFSWSIQESEEYDRVINIFAKKK